MPNTQLVDYIKGQIAAGVSKDAVLGSVRAAGWAEPDIKDVMEFLGANASSAPAQAKSAMGESARPAQPVMRTTGLSMAKESATPANFPSPKIFMSGEGGKRLGDIIAGAKANAVDSHPMLTAASRSRAEWVDRFSAALPAKREHILPAIFGIVIVVLLAGTWILYRSNADLKSQMNTLQEADQATITSLGSRIDTLTGENASLTSDKDAAVQSANQLKAELSLLVAPPAGSGTSVSAPLVIDIRGTVGGGAPYTLVTDDGITMTVKNSKDAGVAAVLKPLLGKSAEITGTHFAASRIITVISVNGVLTQANATSSSAAQ